MGARCPCKPQRGLDKFAAVNYERKTGEAGARCVAQITTGGWVHGKWIREGAKHGKTNKFLGRALEIAPGSPEMTVCTNPERREKWEGGRESRKERKREQYTSFLRIGMLAHSALRVSRCNFLGKGNARPRRPRTNSFRYDGQL